MEQFPRSTYQAEEVVAADGEFTAGDLQRRGSSAHCDHEPRSSDHLLVPLLIHTLQLIGTDEGTELVQVGDARITQLHAVAEVKAFDMVLNIVS